MGVAKWKLKDGSTNDYYAWDGDLTHEPVLLANGVGDTLNGTTGPATYNAPAGAVDTLKNYCRANAVVRLANLAEDIAGNTGAVADLQGLLDELIVHTD